MLIEWWGPTAPGDLVPFAQPHASQQHCSKGQAHHLGHPCGRFRVLQLHSYQQCGESSQEDGERAGAMYVSEWTHLGIKSGFPVYFYCSFYVWNKYNINSMGQRCYFLHLPFYLLLTTVYSLVPDSQSSFPKCHSRLGSQPVVLTRFLASCISSPLVVLIQFPDFHPCQGSLLLQCSFLLEDTGHQYFVCLH